MLWHVKTKYSLKDKNQQLILLILICMIKSITKLTSGGIDSIKFSSQLSVINSRNKPTPGGNV